MTPSQANLAVGLYLATLSALSALCSDSALFSHAASIVCAIAAAIALLFAIINRQRPSKPKPSKDARISEEEARTKPVDAIDIQNWMDSARFGLVLTSEGQNIEDPAVVAKVARLCVALTDERARREKAEAEADYLRDAIHTLPAIADSDGFIPRNADRVTSVNKWFCRMSQEVLKAASTIGRVNPGEDQDQ